MIYPIQLISMALFANDGEETINAWDATAEKSYWCLECRSILKLRRGERKFPHFYHVKASPSCRLYSKSERHLLIQLMIQKILPPSEAILEKPFKSIQRIADVAWEKKKIIFEIQCSPIGEIEAKERTSEYKSLGFDIVWILDDRLFNKKHVSRAEEFIRSHLGYFITHEYLIYDQLEIIDKHERKKRGNKIPVDLSIVRSIPQIKWENPLPYLLKKRISQSKYMFGNDLIEKALQKDFETQASSWAALEQKQPQKIDFKKMFIRYVRDPYLKALKTILNNI